MLFDSVSRYHASPDAAASQITDGLTADAKDVTALGTENYLLGFPYLGTPHSGFSVGTS